MKIFAIGMNYAAHNQELHGTLKRPDEPVIFTKADSAEGRLGDTEPGEALLHP